MKVECDHCRAVVVPAWEIGGGEIRARCPSCGQTSTATVAAPVPGLAKVRFSTPAPPAPDGPPVRTCPKCGNAPVTGAACARCGLAVERMDGWSEDTQVPEELAAAWAACLADWNDIALHERIASLSLTHSVQPWLARRYRAILRERPDDAVAASRLERVGRIAQAAVLASGSSPRASRFSRGSSAVVLVLLALMVAGGLLFTLYLQRKSEEPTSTPALAPPKRAPAVPVEPWQRKELRDAPRVESRPPP